MKEETKECKKCNKQAKYSMESLFGIQYLCGIHIKKWRKNILAIINDLSQ